MMGLLGRAKEDQLPVEIIYMSEKGDLTQRTIIVKEVKGDYIKAFCFIKRQSRIFKMNNILSAAKPKRKEEVKYA